MIDRRSVINNLAVFLDVNGAQAEGASPSAGSSLHPHLGLGVAFRARGIGSLDSSAGKLLRADADEAELAVPGILAVVEEGQE